MSNNEVKFPLSIKDAFAVRRSVRSYSGTFPDELMDKVEAIVEEANKMPTPFNSDNKLYLHKKPGLGTFNSVSGEAGWILICVPGGADDIVHGLYDGSFRLQVAVMKMTQVGVCTVWIGGTFSGKEANKLVPGFNVVCAVCFGIASGTTSSGFLYYISSLIGIGHDSRRRFKDLFFNSKSNESYTEENCGELKEILKAIQSGPSAMNRQPWRLGIDGKTFDLYDYIGNNYSMCDLGIAMGNFYFFYEGRVSFFKKDDAPSCKFGGKYVCTVEVRDE